MNFCASFGPHDTRGQYLAMSEGFTCFDIVVDWLYNCTSSCTANPHDVVHTSPQKITSLQQIRDNWTRCCTACCTTCCPTSPQQMEEVEFGQHGIVVQATDGLVRPFSRYVVLPAKRHEIRFAPARCCRISGQSKFTTSEACTQRAVGHSRRNQRTRNAAAICCHS